MARSLNNDKFYQLRNQYQFFEFESYDIEKGPDELKCVYNFNLNGEYQFHPEIRIPVKDFYRNWDQLNIDDDMLKNILFHIGMVELVSYWKTACPPNVIIRPYAFDDYQKSWWKDLYFKGLGEFFYLNSIETNDVDFMTITGGESPLSSAEINLSEDYIVPVGGGKDSAVSLELLKTIGHVTPLLQNPRKAMTDTIMASGLQLCDSVEIYRTIDKTLLSLNEQGFLNGHTPFSALLAFQSLLAAYLSGKQNIALSNEGSANEATIPGTDVNHQYSKSFAFEKDFRDYYTKYISPSFNYFSFLRPLSELQIAQLFSTFPQHHLSFRSCNAGSKTDSWCGKCPKCLFAWAILSPFLGEERLFQIFGKKLLDDPEMAFYLKQLIGATAEKPFECIGTIGEVQLALFLIREKTNPFAPLLVNNLKKEGLLPDFSREEVESFFNEVDDQNFLSDRELQTLQKHLECPAY